MPTTRSLPARLGFFLAVALSLGGCNAVNRLATIGTPPPMSPITNPTQQPGYRTVSLPIPDPEEPTHMANSLWRQGARLLQGPVRRPRRRHPDGADLDRR